MTAPTHKWIPLKQWLCEQGEILGLSPHSTWTHFFRSTGKAPGRPRRDGQLALSPGKPKRPKLKRINSRVILVQVPNESQK